MGRSKTAGLFYRLLLVWLVVLPHSRVIGFSCPQSEFACQNQRCIELDWKCDGHNDCGDNSDENGCPTKTCNPTTEFTCANGNCITKTWLCDGSNDCEDNSDEATDKDPNCTPRNVTCSHGQFLCANKMCILSVFKCDDEDDCGDNSDEQSCGPTCPPNQFQCTNGNCVSTDLRCDLEDDCGDGSDEHGCETKSCSSSEFKCSASGRCIPIRFRCDGSDECLDKSDEANCTVIATKPTPPPLRCPKDMFVCADKKHCINREWICDGEDDCKDGSDELSCGNLDCGAQEFQCANQRCIQVSQKCDGNDDCGDGSDERSCSAQPDSVCPAGQFQCGGSKTCIDNKKVCNKHPDCPHGEDENRCDINECLDHNGHCLHMCNDTKTGFFCSCYPGYELAEDKKRCRDIDECKIPGMCSQTCVNIKGGFKCSCLDGYVLDRTGRKCKATGPKPSLIFSNQKSIRMLKTDRREYTVAVGSLKNAVVLDFHYDTSMLYWIDQVDNVLQRVKIRADQKAASSQIEDILDRSVLTKPSGIAVDWVGRKLYWANNGNIEVSELNGTMRRTLISGITELTALVVDPSHGYVYWTDSSDPAKIERAGMDGTDRTVLLSGRHLEKPIGLAIDYTIRKLYWIDSKLDTIKQSDMDGSKVRSVVSHNIHQPVGITLFEDHMYWTDKKNIYKANKFTGMNVTELIRDDFTPQDLHVFHRQRQPTSGTTGCSFDNGGCSHLCLVAPNTRGFSCQCPNGLYIQADGKNCHQTQPPPTPKPSVKSSTVATDAAAASSTNPEGVDMAASTGQSSGGSLGVILGAIFGVLALLAIIVVVAFLLTRRKREPKLQILYNPEGDPEEGKIDGIENTYIIGKSAKPLYRKVDSDKPFENVNYQEPVESIEDDEDSVTYDDKQPVLVRETDLV